MMPTYVCSVRPGHLSDAQKAEIAQAITRRHNEATGAPSYYVQVVVDEKASAARFLGGKPAADHIWIRGDIRSGRTVAQRSGLAVAITRDVARIADVEESGVWVYLCNLEPTDMVEYGHVLPLPGQEKAWFDALPEQLRSYLAGLGVERPQA